MKDREARKWIRSLEEGQAYLHGRCDNADSQTSLLLGRVALLERLLGLQERTVHTAGAKTVETKTLTKVPGKPSEEVEINNGYQPVGLGIGQSCRWAGKL